MNTSELYSPTAFIVDDDPLIARAVSRVLSSMTFDVVGTAAEPNVAIAAIVRARPQLVVMDLHLGAQLDGIAIARQLAELGVDSPVVFITGGAAPDLSRLAGLDAVYAYVSKAELGQSLRATIELATMQHAERTRVRKVDRRFGALFEQAAIGVAEIEVGTGRFVEANRRCADIVGYSVEQLLTRDVISLIEPASRALCRARLARAAFGPVTLEAPCRRGDGAVAHLRFDASPLAADGSPAHLVFVIQDVTDRTRAQRALLRQQYLLAESQRIGHIGSFLLDRRTGALTWSDELYALHGVSPREFDASIPAWLELLHPEDRPSVEARLLAYLARGEAIGELRYRIATGDGNMRVLSGRGEPKRDDDGSEIVVGTVRDITESVLAEAALRHSEARYRGVFQHAVGGIVRTAIDGTIIDTNPAFVAILGCATADQLIGTELRTWFLDPAEGSRLDLASVRPGEPLELVWRRLDGNAASVLVDGLVLDEGDERHFLGFVRDLTAERERSAREREAIEASRAKTAFLASMSHELRTPLNAVLGLSEALLERTFGELGDPQVSSLETIHASGRHLLALINDVLDIARVEAGQLSMDAELVPLREPIDESLALVQAQAAQKGIKLRQQLEGELPSIDIDKRRIKQVLINLLGNAVKFSPANAAITLRARRVGADRVELAVADQGPGIAREDQQRIFEPFVTLDRSLAREHGGAGLGLTMVKRIVELHGGGVRVESETGRGSTFVVELPAPPRVVPDAIEVIAPAPAERPTRARTVLLAEDNEANIVTFQGYLEARGYPVRVVRDGASAVIAAAATDVSVVLMDVQLPVLDGLEAVRRIRSAERGAQKVIIALTAYAMPGDEERCLAAGATSYLAKPVRLRQLVEHIDALVGGAA